MHPPLLLPDPLTPRAMGLPIVAGREGTAITDTVYAQHPCPMRLIPFRVDALHRRKLHFTER